MATSSVRSWCGSPTEVSVRVPVLRPVDDFPRRNRFSRFALTLWRAGQRFDRQNGHLHCNGHPEDEHEPRSGCHVRLLMPALLMGSQRLPSPPAHDRETNGGGERILRRFFLFCRILGPIPNVIYRGDNSGGPMGSKPLDREDFDRLVENCGQSCIVTAPE